MFIIPHHCVPEKNLSHEVNKGDLDYVHTKIIIKIFYFVFSKIVIKIIDDLNGYFRVTGIPMTVTGGFISD